MKRINHLFLDYNTNHVQTWSKLWRLKKSEQYFSVFGNKQSFIRSLNTRRWLAGAKRLCLEYVSNGVYLFLAFGEENWNPKYRSESENIINKVIISKCTNLFLLNSTQLRRVNIFFYNH